MIKACIFDLDGTLANTLPTLVSVGNRALAACGYRTVNADRYPALIGKGADQLITGLIYIATMVPPWPGELARVRKEYDKLYAADPLYLTEQYDGIPATLSALTARGEWSYEGRPKGFSEYGRTGNPRRYQAGAYDGMRKSGSI